MTYALPLVSADGLRLAGGWARFSHARLVRRDGPSEIVRAEDVPAGLLERLTSPRPPVAGHATDRPRLMGILNVTPDSFSDGGWLTGADAVREAADRMGAADLLDVGGESTRPGATEVPVEEEAARVAPAFAALMDRTTSIDTRKAQVARAAIAAGAAMVNDVSGGTFDPDMLPVVAESDAALCLMHGPFDPATMQEAPSYANVVLDVYDFLEDRIATAIAAGIQRSRLVADPGIGFGKTEAHNLALLRALPIFHGLGVPLLLGVSRKGFIGRIGAAPQVNARMPGTLALTLHAVSQGVQWHRVHDVAEIAQGLALWNAVHRAEE
ncbi:dihydropteroate synthase [Jannaschia aquimarina]|uniref:Dihydropteroate synthase n=1 Tax=Jannaschia aquimarina TaxID=935700 RepID=A0A0D1CQZ9_9RHOB|nr:dihydropteroate synthase [Jannaschia aquimarina]KIT17202.1 Dihydropteroate synthase [Jannaschia aquimarina]SNT18334.1 dihydropteroate synthase [Jannaschia aquimarina]